MRRVLVALAVALLGTLLLAAPAGAGIGWCKSDPIVLVDGRLVDIQIASSLNALLRVNGPTIIKVETPIGVKAHLILADLGFLRGMRVQFSEAADLQVTPNGNQVRVSAWVPARDNRLPVRLEVRPRLLLNLLSAPVTATGTSNSWVTLTATV